MEMDDPAVSVQSKDASTWDVSEIIEKLFRNRRSKSAVPGSQTSPYKI
ncbi:MAG: hypothetical protein QXU18_10740 [Thermoplasmatales archaeon]